MDGLGLEGVGSWEALGGFGTLCGCEGQNYYIEKKTGQDCYEMHRTHGYAVAQVNTGLGIRSETMFC